MPRSCCDTRREAPRRGAIAGACLAFASLLAGCRDQDAQWTFTWREGEGIWYDHDVQYDKGVPCSRSGAERHRDRSRVETCARKCRQVVAHRPADGSPTIPGAPPGCEETCGSRLQLVAKTCQNLPAEAPPTLQPRSR